jgi:hypothetical protein
MPFRVVPMEMKPIVNKYKILNNYNLRCGVLRVMEYCIYSPIVEVRVQRCAAADITMVL